MRVGICGWGRWAPNLARNIQKHASVTWVCDPSSEARQRAIASGYTATDVPLWASVDAVVIATPIQTHVDLAREALSNGLHCLVEKPLATKRHDALLLTAMARERGLTLMMSAPWLYHAHVAEAVALSKGAEFIEYDAVRTAPDTRGLDAIDDLLPHDVGIFRAVTGTDASRVQVDTYGDAIEVRLSALQPRRSQALGKCWYSYKDERKQRHFEVSADEVSMASDGSACTPEPLDLMLADFVECCRTGATPRHGDPVHVAAVLEAAHKSRALGGEWVDV
jgi:predicted dehydrogenase